MPLPTTNGGHNCLMRRQTPWRDWDEWRQARIELRSEDQPGQQALGRFRRQEGVLRVAAWRLRGAPLPAALDATAEIVGVVLDDEEAELSHSIALAQYLHFC